MQWGSGRLQRCQKLGKVGESIVGSRGGFGVILHGKQGELAVAHALDGAIVQVQMGDLERLGTRDRPGVSNHREAMILRGDQDLAGAQITHRVIAPPVAVRELRGRAAEGEADELMTQTDSEGGQAPAREISDGFDRVRYRGGIARSVRKEESVRV